jgi:DnaJ-class molecular chaperone
VAIHSAPHKLVRHNEDLVLHQKVTLFEALTGISFDLPYLDGRTYRMKFPTRRLPCTPGAEVAKAGWGMPTGKGGRGVLLIIFEVVFPTEWTVNIQALMTQVWPMDQRGEGLSPNDTVEDLPSPQH